MVGVGDGEDQVGEYNVQTKACAHPMSFPFPVRLSQSIIDFTPVLIVQFLIALLFITSRRSPLLWTKQSGPSQKMPPFPARCTQGMVLPAKLTWCPQSKKASGARTKDDISYTLCLSGWPATSSR